MSVDLLGPLMQAALEEAAGKLTQSESTADLATSLLDNRQSACERFNRYLGYGFDELLGFRARKIELGDYPALSLVDEDFVEAANALEGMVNYARNTNIKALISFTTRLNDLFDSQTIDETNNPLDPDRIAVAFVDALAPLEIDPQYALTIYRCFNQRVFHQLDSVLQKANYLCKAAGLMPELVVDGRSREAQLGKRSSVRPTNSPLERVFSDPDSDKEQVISNNSAQLFSLVKDLLWSPSQGLKMNAASPCLVREVAVPTAALIARFFEGSLVSELGLMPLIAEQDMQIAGCEVVIVPDWQLMLLLDEVQDRIIEELSESQELTVDYRRFTSYLGEALLESSPAGKLHAIEGEQLDTILTISLLYDAFCQEVSLVRPVKELIAATQVVMMKLALDDPQLFAIPGHPARLLLNEVAAAGVGSLDHETLKNDPVFIELESILIRLVTEYSGSTDFVSELLQEFNEFKTTNSAVRPVAATPLRVDRGECNERIKQLHNYVRSRIQERIKEPLHPLIDNLVRQHFQRFLMIVVQRDGQGSNSWMLVIKILDLLLWTVRTKKQEGDRERFDKLNTLLLPNIKKMLLVSGLDEETSDNLVERVAQIQENSFLLWTESAKAENVMQMHRRTFDARQAECNEETFASLANEASTVGLLNSVPQTTGKDSAVDQSIQSELQSYLSQVDRLPIGSWLSFQMQGDQALYCTLTARMHAAESLIFVNNKGVKVLEKSREGLALEMLQGSVRIVSEWPLFERGMESVIARLRERQQQH